MQHKIQHPQSILIAKQPGMTEKDAIQKVESMGYNSHFKKHPHETANYYRFRQENPVTGHQYKTEHLGKKDLAIVDKYHDSSHITKTAHETAKQPAEKTDSYGNRWVPDLFHTPQGFTIDKNAPRYHVANEVMKRHGNNPEITQLKEVAMEGIQMHKTGKEILKDVAQEAKAIGLEKLQNVHLKDNDLEKLKTVIVNDLQDEQKPKTIIRDATQVAKQIGLQKLHDKDLKSKIASDLKNEILKGIQEKKPAKEIGQSAKKLLLDEVASADTKQALLDRVKSATQHKKGVSQILDKIDVNGKPEDIGKEIGKEIAKQAGKKIATKLGDRLLNHVPKGIKKNPDSKWSRFRAKSRDFIGRTLKNLGS